ncbi:hypothetical protein [Chryseobacterium sp. KMC2]|uniref:hypothetical protein n=1 Tax=Chryseobacterium sp. KMC2 TaxID=2800705 RepID=UPI001923DA63|nr:hypothetical protein [Chryseobacterium sp. KMC2]MBL3548126.1 hypothetical protein [Chryseobacterium sp. KMC2]
MDKIFEKLFGDFTIQNFIKWLKELLVFYRHPYITIEHISRHSSGNIFSQFLFYLLFSNSFYFLFSRNENGFPLNFNLALDGVLSQFPLLLSFTVSSKIVTKKFNISKIIIFLLLVLFSYTPLQIIVYSNFLRFENYVFSYISSILSFILSLGIVFLWSFAIEINKMKAIKMILINLIFINSSTFFLDYVKIDPYSQPMTFIGDDPIYKDYNQIIKHIYSKEKTPIAFVYENIETNLDLIGLEKKKKLNVLIGTIDGKTNQFTTTYKSTQEYKESIAVNIENLQNLDSMIVFRRNKIILSKWYNQFNKINQIINEHSTTEYFKENVNTFEHILPNKYLQRIVYTDLIVDLVNLEDYHKNVLKNHTNCKNIVELAPYIINLPARFVDNFIVSNLKSDTLKKGPLRYNFENLDDEIYHRYNTK